MRAGKWGLAMLTCRWRLSINQEGMGQEAVPQSKISEHHLLTSRILRYQPGWGRTTNFTKFVSCAATIFRCSWIPRGPFRSPVHCPCAVTSGCFFKLSPFSFYHLIFVIYLESRTRLPWNLSAWQCTCKKLVRELLPLATARMPSS